MDDLIGLVVNDDLFRHRGGSDLHQLGKADAVASITASATFGRSASPDNVACWHIMILQ